MTSSIDRAQRRARLASASSVTPAAADLLLAVAVPIPATVLAAAGAPISGAAITGLLALVAGIVWARQSVYRMDALKYALIVNVLLGFVVAVLSAVYIGTNLYPEHSKLYRLGFSGLRIVENSLASYLTLVWASSLCLLPTRRSAKLPPLRAFTFNERTAAAMLVMGAIGLYIQFTTSRTDAFNARGEEIGNGMAAFLYWSAVIFVVYVVTLWQRGHARLWVWSAALISVSLLFVGNRSPLALLGMAIVVRAALSARISAATMIGVSIPVGLVAFAYQSIWRSLVANGRPSGPGDVLSAMAEDPFGQFLRLGLDTLDGYTLARTIVDEGYPARWLNPLMAVLNFIPRQLWPEKPYLLGSEIGSEYLGLGAGGIFLSGPGYFSLVTGSTAIGLILFVMAVRITKNRLAVMTFHPVATVALIHLIVRFTVAGDAFDIFLTVQALVILLVAALIGRGLPWKN